MKHFFLILMLAIGTAYSASAQLSWIAQESGTTENLNDVYFVSADIGWVVGDNGVVLKTPDGGATWTALSSGSTQNIRTVFFLNETIGWIAGQGESNSVGPLILKTTDGGDNWARQSFDNLPSNDVFAQDISFRNETTGWLVTAFGEIWATTDGGETWSQEPLSATEMATQLNELALTQDRAFAGGRIQGSGLTRRGRIFERAGPNDGLPWLPDQSTGIDTDENIRSLFFLNDTVGFAGGSNGKLYKLENDINVDWELNFDGSVSGLSLINSVSFGDEQTGWIQGNVSNGPSLDGFVYQTTDGGENWVALPPITGGTGINKLFAADTENIWAVGNRGQIVKAAISAGVKEISGLTQVRVYPNPVDDQVQVVLELRETTWMRMDLFNAMGQHIRTLYAGQIAQGVQTLDFNDLGRLAKGVYFLKLQSSEGGIRTLQLMK